MSKHYVFILAAYAGFCFWAAMVFDHNSAELAMAKYQEQVALRKMYEVKLRDAQRVQGDLEVWIEEESRLRKRFVCTEVK